MTERVTLDQAAHRLGLSVRTVRRRVKAGALAAEREETAQGYRYWVLLDSDSTARVDSESDAAGQASESPVLTQLRDENTRLWELVRAQQATIDNLVMQADRFQWLQLRDQDAGRLPAGGQGGMTEAAPIQSAPTPAATRPTRQPRPRSLWLRLLDALRGPESEI